MPFELSAALPSPGAVKSNFPIVFGAGNRVLFLSGGDRDSFYEPAVHELFSVPVDGSHPAQRINPPLAADRDVDFFNLSPDGTFVLYRADQDTNDVFELYRAPVVGGASLRVSAPLVSGGIVWPFRFESNTIGNDPSFAVDASGTRAVYIADGNTDDVVDLYSVPLDGSRIATVLSPLHTSATRVDRFRIAPSGGIAFSLIDNGAGLSRLYGVPIDGSSPPVELTDDFTGWLDGFSFDLTADGAHVVYLNQKVYSYQTALGLFVVPLDGGAAPMRLSVPGPLSQVFASPVRLLNDGHIVFIEKHTGGAPTEVFTALIDGSAEPRRISGEPAVATRGDVDDFALSPDGRWAVYRADGENVFAPELYGVPSDGSQHARRITRVSENNGVLPGYQFHPNSKDVFFVGNPGAHDDLQRVPVDGSADPFVVNGPGGGKVKDYFELTPSGDRALYTASSLSGDFDLWSVPTDGSRAALRMSTGMTSRWGVRAGFLLTPDGSQVVFAWSPNDLVRAELNSARVDGSQPRVLLGAMTGTPQSDKFMLTPDGSRVIFYDDSEYIHSVPTSGGTNVFLAGNAAFSPGGFSSDSTRLVLISTLPVPGLYTVPVDGSAAATRLDASMPAHGTTYSFRLDADRTHTVYRADLDNTGTNELFVVPTGGGTVVRLNAPLVAGGDVTGYRVGGGRVVYLADQSTNDVFELYSVPIGGGAVTRISGPLVAGGDVQQQFQISPDGSFVVYRADAEFDEEYSLFAVPKNGSAPPLRLNKRPVAGGDVSGSPGAFQIAPTSDCVLFIADLDTDDVFELYTNIFAHKTRPKELR